MLPVSTGSKLRHGGGIRHPYFQNWQIPKIHTFRLVTKCNLDDYLWEQLERLYGYNAENPTIDDFALQLFKSAYESSQRQEATMNSQALILLQRWKNDRKKPRVQFEYLSPRTPKCLKD